MFYQMSTRTRRDSFGPVDCHCKKCGADIALVCDRAKQRNLYWVVPLGTTHTVTLVCTGCQREQVVRGTAANQLVQQAIANGRTAATFEALEHAPAAAAAIQEATRSLPPTGAPSGVSDDDRIALLEAELARLANDKRIADLEAEVARLRAEVGESAEP